MNKEEITTALIASVPSNVFADKESMNVLLNQIEAMAEFEGEEFSDLDDPKVRDQIKSLAYKVSRTKTFIDAEGKKLVDELKARCKPIDSARKTAREFLDDLRDGIKKPVIEWEEKDAKRDLEERNEIDSFRELSNAETIDEANENLAVLHEWNPEEKEWRDDFRKDEAVNAKQKTIDSLKKIIDNLQAIAKQKAEKEAFEKEKAEHEKEMAEFKAWKEQQEKEKEPAKEKLILSENMKEVPIDYSGIIPEVVNAPIPKTEAEPTETPEKAEQGSGQVKTYVIVVSLMERASNGNHTTLESESIHGVTEKDFPLVKTFLDSLKQPQN